MDGDEATPRPRGRPPRLTVDERRAAILDAAVEQFAGAPAGAASVESIAAAAGVQKPSVYRLYASKAELYAAAVTREVEWFVGAMTATYDATTALALRDRIDARAAWIVETVRARPMTFRLLVRAVHTWPDDDFEQGIALRASILDAIERSAASEAGDLGLGEVGPAARLVASSTFALTQMVVELVLEGGPAAPDDDRLVAFLARSMEGCVVAAFGGRPVG